MFELRTTKKTDEQSTNCASTEELFALAHNQLAPGDAARIRVHLDTGCKACRRQFEQLQTLVAATKSLWPQAQVHH
ncbi:MAG: hypothetical protein HY314_05635 [Acidobacteria bacterium]|nr:hypothetical protein [Acidobacteriota bacterium]